MSEKINFIVISGASGVGKTTVFNELIRRRNLGELAFDVPLKLTTRPQRDSDNPEEIKSVDELEYEKLHHAGKFLIEFARHGHKYGVLSNVGANSTVLQIIPARDVIPLRETFQNTVQFTILLLNTSADVIHARRLSRGDKTTKSEEASRAKTVENKPVNDVDYIIDAGQAASLVVDDVAKIVKKVSERSDYPSIERTDLLSELKIIADVMRIASQQGVTASLYGGLAANLYGSNRNITDVDVLADSPSFAWLLDHYSHSDMIVTDKKITIGRVEINKTPSRVGDRSLGQIWQYDAEAQSRVRHFIINGHKLPVLSAEDIIVMKAGLGRGESQGKFDLLDINNIVAAQKENGIDYSYIVEKAEKCNAYDRVMSSLRKLNVSFPLSGIRSRTLDI